MGRDDRVSEPGKIPRMALIGAEGGLEEVGRAVVVGMFSSRSTKRTASAITWPWVFGAPMVTPPPVPAGKRKLPRETQRPPLMRWSTVNWAWPCR
jgi:hypothetical protein